MMVAPLVLRVWEINLYETELSTKVHANQVTVEEKRGDTADIAAPWGRSKLQEGEKINCIDGPKWLPLQKGKG